MQMTPPYPHTVLRADSDRRLTGASPPHLHIFRLRFLNSTMPFDTVVLNDGTGDRPFLAHLTFRFLSGPGPAVPGSRVRNRYQMERNCKLGAS